VLGRERTGILSPNHVRAFSFSFSKAETGFKRDILFSISAFKFSLCRYNKMIKGLQEELKKLKSKI